MNPVNQHDDSSELLALERETWETPTVNSCAVRDTAKIHSNFAEDPMQGIAGS